MKKRHLIVVLLVFCSFQAMSLGFPHRLYPAKLFKKTIQVLVNNSKK